MKGDPLPDDHHVVRYVGGSLYDQGQVDGNAFALRPGESALSVNWLDVFPGDQQKQIAEVRRVIRIELRPTAVFACVGVGSAKELVKEIDEASEIAIVEDPLEQSADYPPDPSHALVLGLPDPDSATAEAIGDIISQNIVDVFPARG